MHLEFRHDNAMGTTFSLQTLFKLMRNLLVAGCAVFLAGCTVETSFLKYPPEWKAVRQEATACPNLTGVYQYHGNVGSDSSLDGMALLNDFMNFTKVSYQTREAVEKANAVSVLGPVSDTLMVSFFDNNQQLFTTTFFAPSDFGCRGGSLWFLTHGKEGPSYKRTEDGALVSHTTYFDVYEFLFFAVVKTGSYWRRWELIASSGSPKSTLLENPKLPTEVALPSATHNR